MSLKQKLTVLVSAGATAIALTVIAHFEGVRYEPYEDVGGVLTVCYGHTGKDIVPNKVYSKEECNELLELDFMGTKLQVDHLVKVPVNEHTKAALYSFAFNVGTGAFAKSTMLKKLNSGDQYGACEELKKWVYAGGKVWRGLVNRREAEAANVMIDIRETLLSQYANSPCITSILKSVNEAIDPRQSSDEFYHLAINVLTAQGFGLDIWGRIIGINRGLTIPDPDADYFGFDGTEKYLPFNQAPFFGDFKNESSYLMTDPTFREVIIMKAYANIINATAPNINAFLKTSFTRGKAYFLITGHMKGRYVFEYRLSELEKNLIFNHSILPRPSGVEITIRELPYADYFGFFGSGLQTFNQAPFIK